MAITSLDQYLANLSAPVDVFKASATAEGAGTFHSLFLVAGRPGAGATPPAFSAGSGYVPTKATQGAIPYTNPASGNRYLARLYGSCASAGMFILYDRLWACSGFGTVVTTAQNVTTPGALTRPDANGENVEIWGEVYSAPGATGATWTVSYTNQAGVSGRTATYTHPANAESVGQMFPFTLQAGDTGVRSVESFTASVSSGTAGNIGITLLRRLAPLPIPAANAPATMYDGFALGLPQIYTDACLALMVMCSGTTTGIFAGGYVAAGDALAGGSTANIEVSVGGSLIGTRPDINLIAGTNMTVSGADNPGANRVDVTLSSSGGGGGGGILDVQHFQAESLDGATTDWTNMVTDPAPLDISVSSNSIQVRSYSGSVIQAAGGKFRAPAGAANLKLEWIQQARTAPGTTNNKVQWRLAFRPLGSTSAPTTYDFTAHTIANNTSFAAFDQTVSLATLGMTAGVWYQFQLQRVISGVSNNMTQDCLLSEVIPTWT